MNKSYRFSKSNVDSNANTKMYCDFPVKVHCLALIFKSELKSLLLKNVKKGKKNKKADERLNVRSSDACKAPNRPAVS